MAMHGKYELGSLDENETRTPPTILLSDQQPPEGEESGGMMWCGCLSIKFYKPYFNVDTAEVRDRFKYSLFPFRKEAAFFEVLGGKPDVYGPFWTATTLIFIIAIMTNLSSWIAFTKRADGKWEYDITKLVTCTSIVYGFMAFVPLAAWGAFTQIEVKLTLVEVLCVYGYSLAVYVPAVLLCMVPVDWVSWLSLVFATAISVIFILRTLTPVLLEQNQSMAVFAMAGFGIVQLAFMLLLKLMFFSSSIF